MPSQKDGKEYRNSKQPGTAILLSEQERNNSGESSNLHNVDTFGMFALATNLYEATSTSATGEWNSADGDPAENVQ